MLLPIDYTSFSLYLVKACAEQSSTCLAHHDIYTEVRYTCIILNGTYLDMNQPYNHLGITIITVRNQKHGKYSIEILGRVIKTPHWLDDKTQRFT